MSQLAFTLREEGYEVLPLFSSLTSKTSDATNIIQYIVEELERKIPATVDNYDEKINVVQKSIDIGENIKNFFENRKILFKICRAVMMGVYKVFKVFTA